MNLRERKPLVDTLDPTYRGLYRLGAAAAWIAALLFRRNLDAEWWLFRSMGVVHTGPEAAPTAIADWFALLRTDRLLGLTLLNLFDLVNYALVGLIFLALVLAIKGDDRSGTLLAGLLCLAGVGLALASNQAIVMLSLSGQYVVVADPTQRLALLAAGQAVLAIHNRNTFAGGLHPSYLFVSLAGLILAALMLKSPIFGKSTAWAGVLANAIGLGYYPLLALTPGLVYVPLSISAVFLLAWYLLAGHRLWTLGAASAGAPEKSIRKSRAVQTL